MTSMTRTAFSLPLAALLFNAVLCFVNTRGIHVGKAGVEAVELAIVAGALLLSWRHALASLTVPAILLCLNIAALALLSGRTDPKILIDVAIPAGFFLLGRAFADEDSAGRLLCWAAVLVAVFGLYEMFALPSFEHWFHVFDYYVDKGALSSSHANDTGTTLAENGVRPGAEGRQLFPGLFGLHRAGSVFLEPVSAGDFTAICTAWVCATRIWARHGGHQGEHQGGHQWARPRGLAILACGLLVGVLADARFSIVSAAAIAVFLATPLWRSRLLVAAMPVMAIVVLLFIGAVSGHEVDNSTAGRLTGSGQLLIFWSIWDWLGLEGSRFVSLDTGYSYVIGNLGLLAAGLVWIAACTALPRTGAAGRLFAAISVYLTLSLCISSSSLSIKTAALLWFALGGLCTDAPRRVTAPAALRVRLPGTLRRPGTSVTG